MSTTASTTARIAYLDILRGLAILFIFLANLLSFSGWYFVSEEAKAAYWGSELDKVLDFLIYALIDGKWYSIFSILFGIGFALQYEKLKERGASFVSFFSKRMSGLLILGSLHLFFIWLGDILTLYAILGFVLILFRKVSDKRLWYFIIILILLPVLHTFWMFFTESFYMDFTLVNLQSYLSDNGIIVNSNEGMIDFVHLSQLLIDGESWQQLFTMNFGMPYYRFGGLLYEARFAKVLACFLIGLWAGRAILHQQLLENRSLLKRIMWIGLLIGLPFNIFRASGLAGESNFAEVYNSIFYAFGVIPLACSYAAMIALWSQKKNNFLSHFAPVGKMALSNYILHSFIGISIFYGVGLGLGFDTPLWSIVLIGLVVFLLQMALSKLWLKHFQFGPLEWLWRVFTYGKNLKIRR